MPRAYSGDMRQRVIAEVESGASRREAAEEFEVSASTAIIWVKCFRETGRCMPKLRGGSISPLEKHAHFLLDLIEQQPDLTLDEVILAITSIAFLAAVPRSGVSFSVTKLHSKKAYEQPSSNGRTWRERAGAGCENRACLTPPVWSSLMRPPRIQRWCGCTAAARAASASSTACRKGTGRPSPLWPRSVAMACARRAPLTAQ